MGSDTASNFSGFSKSVQIKKNLKPAPVFRRLDQTTKQWQIKEVEDSQMNSPFNAEREIVPKLGWTRASQGSVIRRASKGFESIGQD